MAITRRSILTGAVASLAGGLASAAMPRVAAAFNPARPPLEGEFARNFVVRLMPSPAQPISFGTIGEREVSIESFRGRTVLMNFWATWCPPCIGEMPQLNRVQKDLGDAGLAVVAVAQDRGGESTVSRFLKGRGLNHLIPYTDPDGDAAEAYGVSGIPTSFLIDPNGLVVGHVVGPVDWTTSAGLDLLRFYLPATTQSARS